MLFNMLSFLRILVIGAHPDDIELGCAGFIYRLVKECKAKVEFLIVSPGLKHWKRGQGFQHASRVKEAVEAAGTLEIPEQDVDVLEFKDCELHLHLHDIIEQLELRIADAEPEQQYDLILSHAKADTHADHTAVYQATVAATRSYEGTVLLFQGVSTIPNEFHPVYFVNLDAEAIAAKQRALNCHASQREKDFMQRLQTEGIPKSWACFLRKPDQFFEAFEVYKSYWWQLNG
ncbi:MAG: PIG-L deacetylase family protein [Planctomycetota bacterium]